MTLSKTNANRLFADWFRPSLNQDHALNGFIFGSMVKKEIADHIKSWRVLILIGLVVLTCGGSLYVSLSHFYSLKGNLSDDDFFFLNLFSASDGSLPSFLVLVGFLGPLLGIGLGFDAINSEHNKGTLSNILSQPVPRDFLINAKFVSSIILIAALFLSLSLLIVGCGLIATGIPPTLEELFRIATFTVVSIVYVSLWLNLAILFSVRFRQPATSALMNIAVWLFFMVFYPLLTDVVTKSMQPSPYAPPSTVYAYQKVKYLITQLMPNQIFTDATNALLRPGVRSVGPLTMEQVQGSLPGPLPLGQSLLVIWPQLTGLIAVTMLCFLISYLLFMKRDIRRDG